MAATRRTRATPKKAAAKKTAATRKRATPKKTPAKRGAHGGKRPGAGRPPTDLAAVIERRDDGHEITISDRVVETLRLGGFDKDAAARVGVRVETLREWQAIGARAAIKIEGDPETELDAHERQCLDLYRRVVLAVAEARSTLFALVQREITGGRTVTETRTKTVAGAVTEQTTIDRTMLPNADLLKWWLTARFPDEFSKRVEVTGAGGEPLAVDVTSPLDRIMGTIDRIRSQHSQADALRSMLDDHTEPAD